MKSNITPKLLILLLSATYTFVQAEESKKLNEITVVTSTKTPRILAEVPVRTQVVTKEDIQRNHAKNLAEALRYVPGIQLKPIHGKTGQGVWMQGFDADRVLILIDGNPLTPSSGSTVDVTQVAIGDVERIEIIKGAVSAMYGASAMGGVINVITREPSAKSRLVADVTGGNWGDQSEKDNPVAKNTANFEVSTKQENWYAQVVADLMQSDGYKATDLGNATQGWHGHKNTLSAKLQYKFDNDIKLTLMPRYFDEDASTLQDFFSPGIGWKTRTYNDKATKVFLSTVLEKQAENFSWKVRALHEDYQSTSKKASKRELVTQNSQLASEFGIHVDESHLINFGLEYNKEYMDAKNISTGTVEVDDKSKNSYELYVQDSWLVNDKLEILPGIRFDYDDRDSGHLSPMISSLYQAGKVNFRAGIGSGYRTPTLKELYYLFDHSQIGYIVQGNTDLKPESSLSYQLGAEWMFSRQGSFEVSLFYNDINDLIETALDSSQTGPNNASVYTYLNYNKAITQGAEVVFRQHFAKYFQADISYVYLDAEDQETNKKLTNRSEHEAKLGLDWFVTKDTTLTAKLNYQSEHYIDEQNTKTSPGYSSVDFKFNQQINREWLWYLGVDNVTGEQRDFKGQDFRPEEGRYVYLGLRWVLEKN